MPTAPAATATATSSTTTMRDAAAWRATVTALQNERLTDAQRKQRERMARQNTKPPVRAVNRTVVYNDWERAAPLNVHREPDRECHHPLVKCSHKW